MFHPVIARWFSETLGTPTPAQERGWREIRAGQHTLIAAPTGSGKTLAAFLAGLDDLFQEGLRSPLPDEVRIVYVSPLKALSADIHKNLAQPRRGIKEVADRLGIDAPRITAAVRTGDTTSSERARMLRTPPHILVTTPESLFLLLTAERSRQILRTVRTVIVDEIHAVIGTRRGAHLALSLERLQQVAESPLIRIGLSATQRPIDAVARFLVGAHGPCAIIDEGHRRDLDLDLDLPKSSLEAVMSHEIWEEYYDRLAELVRAHRTTLVFVNTRRMAERVARHLSDRIGEETVTAHHGSLSKEKRLDAEARLKGGHLKALVATASLELGIDIGHVDLVCQIGSPHRIATLLQRVGRSGHTVSGTPKGRVLPLSRDDLVEMLALLRAVRRGSLDCIVSHDQPLDVLAQQLVAETACREYTEDDLFALVRQAWPYRLLERTAFDQAVAMIAEGFTTRRGRRGALVHRDEVHHRLRGRRGARMLALTSGGAIPEVADYRVVLEPDDTFIGTLNEDFAIESMAGDIFQLGNASWRVLQVATGVMRVADAKGAPPNIPFWLGEAPARSDELSREVSDLRADIERRLNKGGRCGKGKHEEVDDNCADAGARSDAAVEWLRAETGADAAAAQQAVDYIAGTAAALGAVPTQETLVLERFFDESGGMQLVLHAPFGSRINKAWGLALRKRFCRQFNFELQAAATEDALLLSLGPQHSFPLADVFRYLHPATAKDVLVQALLDAPVFQTRWRWNTTISLAVPRFRAGRKVPPQLQRMQADDLMAAVFPDAAACLENIPGDRQVPDHPLVSQAIRDCLEEAMDFNGLARVLTRIHAGELRLVSRDTPEPSPFSHEILNARPYAFLDDAPLEERRTQAVYARRATEPSSAGDIGALDPEAIARVRDEVRPDPRDADELHDAIVTSGFLTVEECGGLPRAAFDALAAAGRVTRVDVQGGSFWVAAERLPELFAVHPTARLVPAIVAPPGRAARAWSRGEAMVEILRGRLAIAGPTTTAAVAASVAIVEADAHAALLDLEGQGVVLRGQFTAGTGAIEWCDRRLLARIHRYTLNRLRAEIEPVTVADFTRFLFAWQHADPAHQLTGADGLRAVVARLDGFELPAKAWERAVLPARLDRYESPMLDMLCLTGQAGWGRLSAPLESGSRHSMRVALFLREHADAWQTLRFADQAQREAEEQRLDETTRRVLAMLRSRGASFLRDLATTCALDETSLATTIVTLAACGLVTSDGFAGVRAIARALTQQPVSFDRRRDLAGRWSATPAADTVSREAAIEEQARALLGRYGVVFRRLLARETNAVTWRELTGVYRRLEARGEIRGGRFVGGMSGEQFALPDAVERLREVRRSGRDGRLITISAVDPLNLTGIVTSGDRVRAITATRIVYRDGVALAALEGDYLRPLSDIEPNAAGEVASALAGRRVPAVTSGFVGR
ncbi:MAG TPA: DEAD/DEAH box helicase [Vicinamibacterales bacterium]|nr:DEAD/DEAH box helicase [Vicinamibacterales bacterium]